MKGDAEDGARARTDFDTGRQGNRESVHGHTEGDEEDCNERHEYEFMFYWFRHRTTLNEARCKCMSALVELAESHIETHRLLN